LLLLSISRRFAGRGRAVGRSAVIAGAILVVSGLDAMSAFKAISRVRGVDVPETNEQHQWLKDFADWFVITKTQ